MAAEPEGIGADLEEGGLPVGIDRENARVVGRPRPIAHVDHVRIARRQQPAERPVDHANCFADREHQRRRIDAALRRQRQDLAAETEPDDRLAEHQAGAGEADLGVERRQRAPACRCQAGTPGPAAEQDQPVTDDRRLGDRSASGKWPGIAKSNAAAFEMVLDLAEPFGLGVLDDRDVFHCPDPG